LNFCRHSTSGWWAFGQLRSRSWRARTEFTFQVAIFIVRHRRTFTPIPSTLFRSLEAMGTHLFSLSSEIPLA
jgi:hypothetical protein